MRQALALGLGVVTLSSLAATATAAGVPGIQVHVRANPTLVDQNVPVRVRLIVYALTQGGRVLTDARRFHLVAVSPLGDRVAIGLRHVGRGTWSGTIRLRVSGRWLIKVSDWPSGTPPSIPVHVREPAPLPNPNPSPR